MSAPKLIKPTESELEILQILWEKGLATVREVHEELSLTKDAGYTTTLKLMQIMAAKKLVVRDESERTHVYRPALEPSETQTQLVSDLVHRAFGGSATALVLQALSAHPPTPDELSEIKKLITGFQARHSNQAPNKAPNRARTGSSK